MSTLDPNAGTVMIEGARVAVLGYDADARAHALALRRAGNMVAIGLPPEAIACWHARADGFFVEHPGAVVVTAEIIVVRAPDGDVTRRHAQPHVPAGALVVFACARALQAGACARSGMDVTLVTNVDDPRVGCRIAVHRDVTQRALARASAYARAAFAPGVVVRATSIAEEAELELESGERSDKLLALAVAQPVDVGIAEPAELTDDDGDGAAWFYAMLNRRGQR